MSRNRHPEQTVDNIINTAAQLFIEKGYEQTSVQDILDALSLSKGGLYHHFASKEEILNAVLKKQAQVMSATLMNCTNEQIQQNGKEKLHAVLKAAIQYQQSQPISKVMNSQIHNSFFIVNGMKTNLNQDAILISTLIENGMQDGSLPCKDARFGAEILLLLLNFWVNPALFERDEIQTQKRLLYLQDLLKKIGVDILDEELMQLIIRAFLDISETA